MPTLAISSDLLDGYARLERRTRNRVSELADIFRRSTVAELGAQAGVNLEKHTGQRDERARTVRITDNLRGILCALSSDKFILHLILPHDQSDQWMARNRFRANIQTGALEVVDIEAVEEAFQAPPQQTTDAEPLFAHRRDKDFRQLGVDEELLPALRLMTDEDHLSGLLNFLPPGQAEALIELSGNASVDEIFGRIAGDFEPGSIGEDDLEAALETAASRAQFHVIADEAELQEMLARPLAKWKTFLHPSQHALAYKPTFNGPARVTGGAGTGKTVVAIHRAAHLAIALDAAAGKPILFTTFTKNLAEAIEADLVELAGADVLDRVEVIHADLLAHRIVREAEGEVKIANDADMQARWQAAADELGLDYRGEFLANEWEQVILAQGCRSRTEYFSASRAGRGVRLDRRARADVWRAVEHVTQQLADRKERTFLQLADAAAGHLRRREVRPYLHVVVDEAQDMHEAQWRMLRAAVADAPNDMFLVGDSHQRIYDRRSSLSKVGINIRGRSHKLRINYRTTHEILRWSLGLLGTHSYDDLDEGEDTHDFAGYHSFMHGPEPTLQGAQSRRAEIDALVEQVNRWVEDGVKEEDIAVTARINGDLDAVEERLRAAGRKTCRMTKTRPTASGVRLGNMHRVKGLEFRCVAITNVSDEKVPLPFALTDKGADEVQHRHDLQREGCLIYVAATRAREDLWVGWSGTPSRFLGIED